MLLGAIPVILNRFSWYGLYRTSAHFCAETPKSEAWMPARRHDADEVIQIHREPGRSPITAHMCSRHDSCLLLIAEVVFFFTVYVGGRFDMNPL